VKITSKSIGTHVRIITQPNNHSASLPCITFLVPVSHVI